MAYKKRQVLHYINFGIFPGGVLFSNGFDVDELLKLLRGEWKEAFKQEYDFFKNSNYAYAKIYSNTGKIYYFIFTKEQFRFTDEEYCKLAHEVLHICQSHLVDILDRDKEKEAEAYLHTHIMRECLRILRTGKK